MTRPMDEAITAGTLHDDPTPPKVQEQKEPFKGPFQVMRRLPGLISVEDANGVRIVDWQHEPTAQWLCDRLNASPPPAHSDERAEFEAWWAAFEAWQARAARTTDAGATTPDGMCLRCNGTGQTGAAYSLETQGPKRDRERQQAAGDMRVTCWECGGTGRIAAHTSAPAALPICDAATTARQADVTLAGEASYDVSFSGRGGGFLMFCHGFRNGAAWQANAALTDYEQGQINIARSMSAGDSISNYVWMSSINALLAIISRLTGQP